MHACSQSAPQVNPSPEAATRACAGLSSAMHSRWIRKGNQNPPKCTSGHLFFSLSQKGVVGNKQIKRLLNRTVPGSASLQQHPPPKPQADSTMIRDSWCSSFETYCANTPAGSPTETVLLHDHSSEDCINATFRPAPH